MKRKGAWARQLLPQHLTNELAKAHPQRSGFCLRLAQQLFVWPTHANDLSLGQRHRVSILGWEWFTTPLDMIDT